MFKKWGRTLVFVLVIALSIPIVSSADGKAGYAANAVINHIFKSTSYTAPSNTYIGLLSTCPAAAPNYTSTGTELSTSGTGYARAGPIAANSGWSYTAATSSTPARVTNAAVVNFATATSSWSVDCFGVYDNSSGGNLLYWGHVTGYTVTVPTNSVASFAQNALIVSEG